MDLFSGIGGITLALKEWVTPVAYCEINPYARAVLVSRMSDGQIPTAPIWDDVTTLHGAMLPVKPEIIYGGFPCQDISVAGRGAGLGGERSGLFYEIARLVGEIRPSFVFLENVPAITIRGLRDVVGELSRLRYDCRWGILSAADMGAPHRRDRWWLLAYSMHGGRRELLQQEQEFGGNESAHIGGNGKIQSLANSKSKQSGRIQQSGVPADARTGSEIADRQTDRQTFSTPRASDANGASMNRIKGAKGENDKRHQLREEVVAFPTPTARAGQNPGVHGNGGQILATTIGGQLNPTWVEWLMGYPLGWTVLPDWATQWFQQQRKKRSKDCAA